MAVKADILVRFKSLLKLHHKVKLLAQLVVAFILTSQLALLSRISHL